MKLQQLVIEKLYGNYNYNIKLNQDVTFIYGNNGCGKTTVLNIIEAIITGQLYKLFSFPFHEIKLYYGKSPQKSSVISVMHPHPDSLTVSFENTISDIQELDESDLRSYNDRDRREMHQAYFKIYPFLNKIKSLFNYVYLPLNRTHTAIDTDEVSYMAYRHYRDNSFYDEIPLLSTGLKDPAMVEIESLIYRSFSRINSKLNALGDEFRNNILQSALSVESKISLEQMMRKAIMNRSTVPELERAKESYTNILQELHLNASEEKITDFFNGMIKDYKTLEENSFEKISLDFFIRYNEMIKIKEIVAIAEHIEAQKSMIRKPLETFLDTINSFIYNEEDGKTIKIDQVGRIYFTTKYNNKHISIHYLSSGEKQLLMFFANLIFKVRDTSAGIFVVDEPELSLHLSWQRIFVEKALEINRNIQLIFATHSPEMIGAYRNRMFKIVREYDK